jgi:hypothetical protein
MKDKTAMQELLEWVRKTLPMDLDTPRMIEDKIESLLKVEQEQIAKAYNSAVPFKFGEQYYNEKYAKNT